MVCIGYGETMADPSEDILGEKTLRYKRNVFVISFVFIAVQTISGLELTSIPFLGTALKDSDINSGVLDFWTWFLALLIFGYNAIAYWYYGKADYELWLLSVLGSGNDALPHIHILTKDYGPEHSFEVKFGTHKGGWKYSQPFSANLGHPDRHTYSKTDENGNTQNVDWDIFPKKVAQVRPIYRVARVYEFIIPVTAGGIALLICLGNLVAQMPAAYKVFNLWLLDLGFPLY
jgi:hypothetical protein